MDINLLVINVGNTRAALGVFVDGMLESTRRVDVKDAAALSAAVGELWEKIATADDAEVCGASVNAVAIEAVEHAIMQATQKPVQWVGRDVELPIKVLTQEPKKTGADRVLNVAAAFEQMQHACVVVDAGTALTIDACNEQGDFIGGAIVPGASLMLKSLHEHTAALPSIELAFPTESIGTSTEQAMLSGVVHGIRGMVKEIVEQYALTLGNWPEIICTGGDAKLLFEGWELVHAIAPDLTLYGIALAYTEHHIHDEN